MKNFLKMRYINLLAFLFTIALVTLLSGCDDDYPVKEDTPEMITKVILTFTPQGGGSDVIVTASDPDGEGVQNITVDGPISLGANKSYVLDIALINELAQP